MNLRRGINADELQQLYVNDRLTIEEIASRYGCGASTIRRRLDDLGIPTRLYTDRYNTFKNEKYVYERLSVRFASASLSFLEWLHANTVRLIDVRGSVIAAKPRPGHSPLWNLKFAHHDSIRLFKWIYYAPDVPCLARKRDKAMRFLQQSDALGEK